MTAATKRFTLRLIHLVLSIPILGYIYGPIEQVQQYAAPVRYIFVPVILLSGYWMFAGAIFALLGVATWLGAYQLGGFPAALPSQLALFIGLKVWQVLRGAKFKKTRTQRHEHH